MSYTKAEDPSHLADTFFAPTARATDIELRRSVDAVMNSSVMSFLLEALGNLVVVLNENRQILAVNDGLFKLMGAQNPIEYLGLRPGEVLGCIHADDHSGGCGTSRFCAMCGAVHAIMEAQKNATPAERECLLTLKKGNADELRQVSAEFRVRAVPIEQEGLKLVVLVLEDIGDEKRRRAVERSFFHDLNNLLTGILGNADLMEFARADKLPSLAKKVGRIAEQAAQEIESYRLLAKIEYGDYVVSPQLLNIKYVLEQLASTFADHPSSTCHLQVEPFPQNLGIESDSTLIHQILSKMVKNALEATEADGSVRVWCESAPECVTFHVWNAAHMTEEVAMRVFQRYFSTKPGSGRGLGTYSMKLFAEKYLGGHVGFSTNASDGTVFYLSLPKRFPGTWQPVLTDPG